MNLGQKTVADQTRVSTLAQGFEYFHHFTHHGPLLWVLIETLVGQVCYRCCYLVGVVPSILESSILKSFLEIKLMYQLELCVLIVMWFEYVITDYKADARVIFEKRKDDERWKMKVMKRWSYKESGSIIKNMQSILRVHIPFSARTRNRGC
ncbi:hypothetical protein DM860_005606 [Cuscuta australis]|uniref:Uncharacterized protein n=1 Tax=Cuscuta australis TaxID=267555 RepID=A0A328DRA0_9ASTE|nr:hypothetical protein DM860_005606 [Cuscuta australis]